jgi:hypothetical protein
VALLRNTLTLLFSLLLVACGGDIGPTEARIAAMPDAELRDHLLELVERDQAARDAMIAAMRDAEPAADGSIRLGREATAAQKSVAAIDAESTAFLETMIHARGWPTRSAVGEEAAHAAWLLAQHADAKPELQSRVLALMEPLVEQGEARADDVALLTDRVLIARGDPQVYGTQFMTDDEGVLRPQPTRDWESVDQRRAEVGLPPMAEYAEALKEVYGQPVELRPAR